MLRLGPPGGDHGRQEFGVEVFTAPALTNALAIAGGYLGARMQHRLPDTLIRRAVGILAIALAAQFLRQGVS